MTKPLLFVKEKYEVHHQVGEGTYGQVFKGKCIASGEPVALKKFRIETEHEGFSITAVREIKILQKICHQNIVNMKEIIMAQPPDKDVFIVFDYLEHDLAGLLKAPAAESFFSPLVVKGIIFQLLNGLAYLHDTAKVLHRDIKSSNVLIGKLGQVKLADFGLAKNINAGYDGHLKSAKSLHLTNRIITLWFRPPEILLGTDRYGPEVDVWSLGCIFAELLLGKAPFAGSDEVTQLEAIMTGLFDSTEAYQNALKVMQTLPWFPLLPAELKNLSAEALASNSLSARLKSKPIHPEMREIIYRMLSVDPASRPSCQQLLQDRFFAECSTKRFQDAYVDAFKTSPFFTQELKYESSNK